MKFYLPLLTGIAALVTSCNNPIRDPSAYQNDRQWEANCSMQTQRTPFRADIFELECWFNNGQVTVTQCNFPRANETGEVEDDPYIYVSQFANYRGSNALSRAKNDFDACPQLARIVFEGSRHNLGKLSARSTYSAISPWTLDKITTEELQKVANLFKGYTVAAYTEQMGL